MSPGDGKKPRRRFSATSMLTAAGRARRRYNCDEQGKWDERATTTARLLAENRPAWVGDGGGPVTIADFGAGNERMRSLLDQTLEVDHTYHPFDLHPQLGTTTPLDVSQGLPNRDFDLAICLGLLEYLPSIPDMAAELHRHCRFALTSYMIADGPFPLSRPEREERNWTTHATEAELRADFAAVGFEAVASAHSNEDTTLIVLWGGGPSPGG